MLIIFIVPAALLRLVCGSKGSQYSEPQTGYRVADPINSTFFLQYERADSPGKGGFKRYRCGVEWDSVQMSWDPQSGRCAVPLAPANASLHHRLDYERIRPRLRRQVGLPSSAQIGIVGAACVFNTDCLTGAYCEVQRCRCYTTYISIGGFCKQKINPEQSGCESDLQCTAVWPNTRCDFSGGRGGVTGVCRCPFNTQPINTLDGPVCFIPNECPTNGANAKLTSNGVDRLESCTFFAVAPNPLTWVGCQPDGGPGRTHDCIPDTPANPPASGSGGYCCPSRSFACIQPLDSGSRGIGNFATSTRWYYNSVTKTCLTFTYLGTGGNANNYLSQEQCESYCSNICERGNPQYSSTSVPVLGTNAQSNNWRYCSTGTSGFGVTTTCGANYACEDIGTQSVCCPSPTFVCGQLGGIQGTSLFQGTVKGSVAQNSQVSRWRWSPTQGQCVSFTYNGQSGDYNNFFSQQDCTSYCSQSLCAQGEPLKDNSGLRNLACGGSTACPSDYECTNSVCCPRTRTVCNQPIFTGASNCASGGSSIRYAFLPSTGSCQQFTYTGCLGNANNFDTISACQTFCSGIAAEPKCEQGKAYKDAAGQFYTCSAAGNSGLFGNNFGTSNTFLATCPSGYTCAFDSATGTAGCCPTRRYTCTVATLDTGRACNPSTSTRYYFDSSTLTCKSFQYLGCDGNSNNFPTKRDCDDYCGTSGCPNGGTPATIGSRLNANPIRCNSAATFGQTAGTCPSNHECTQVSVTQFGTTTRTTASVCCPNRIYICSINSDIGTQCLTAPLTRWFFNTATRTCQQFTFRGCSGNANNFPNQEACNNFCLGAACATGEGVFKDTNNNVQTCNPAQVSACPGGFRCTANPLNLGQGICCGSNDGGVCPQGQAAFVDGTTNEPRTCVPNSIGNCPNAFLCVYDSFSGGASGFGRNSYCCGPRTSPECPAGSSALLDPNTNSAQACTLGASNVCNRVPGYSCQTTTATANVFGYCCTGSSTVVGGVCGAGSVQLSGTGTATECTSGGFTSNFCGAGYTCTPSATQNGRNYCCSPVSATNVCPSSEVPFFSPSTQQISTCNAVFGNSGQACPGNFICRTSGTGNGLSYCCTQVDSGAYCGEARVYVEPGTQQPRSCVPQTGVNTCPAGYICELSAPIGAYYCCSGSGCPAGYEGLPSSTGASQQCSAGFNTCPGGYSCVQGRGTNGVFRCCRPTSVGAGSCPNSQTAYIDQNTGQPQACAGVNGARPCPQGFLCTNNNNGGFATASICCQQGGGVALTCPNGQTAAINPGTGTAATCVVGVVGSGCPFGSVCARSSTGQGVCCQSNLNGNIGACPNGQSPFIDSGTGTPRGCIGSGQSTCPFNFACTVSTTGQGMCCRSSATQTRRCQSGSTPLIDTNGLPRACTSVGSTVQCGNGYACVRDTTGISNGANVCCPADIVTCPSGGTVLVNQATQTAQTCQGTQSQSRLVPDTCPAGYACTATPSGRANVCCQGAGGSTGTNILCPGNQQPFRNFGSTTPYTCTLGGVGNLGCPANYQCSSVVSSGRTSQVCCPGSGGTNGGGSGDCASGRLAFSFPGTTRPLECRGRESNCPFNYACEDSPRYNTKICCRSLRALRLADDAAAGAVAWVSESAANATARHNCSDGTVWSGKKSKCLKSLRLGSRGCVDSVECAFVGATCQGAQCRCPSPRLAFKGACVSACPSEFRDAGGYCVPTTAQSGASYASQGSKKPS